MKRDMLCKRCGSVICQKEYKKELPPKVINKLCDNCRNKYLQSHKEKMITRNKSQKQRKICSDRMKTNNPMFNKETRASASDTLKKRYSNGELKSVFFDKEKMIEIRAKTPPLSEENRKKFSDRMKENNPMSNKEIANRVSRTLKSNIDSGKVKYKRGPEHHLWKGNRTFNDLCRQILYPIWTKLVLDRDEYTCTMCGSKRKLQVHHIKPLRYFIELVRNLYQITVPMVELDDNLRYEMAIEIAKLHTLNDGITVCTKCHSKIDERYHEGKSCQKD